MQVPEEQFKLIEPAHAWVRDRLKQIRLARGFTQDQLGKLLGHAGAAGSRVCDFEQGRSDWKGSTLLRHARFLGVSMDKLWIGCPKWTKGAKPDDVVVIDRETLESIVHRHASDTVSAKILNDIASIEL